MMRKFTILAFSLFVISLSLSACGKKNNPIPPKDIKVEEVVTPAT